MGTLHIMFPFLADLRAHVMSCGEIKKCDYFCFQNILILKIKKYFNIFLNKTL
jgi:hypothetical protein